MEGVQAREPAVETGGPDLGAVERLFPGEDQEQG